MDLPELAPLREFYAKNRVLLFRADVEGLSTQEVMERRFEIMRQVGLLEPLGFAGSPFEKWIERRTMCMRFDVEVGRLHPKMLKLSFWDRASLEKWTRDFEDAFPGLRFSQYLLLLERQLSFARIAEVTWSGGQPPYLGPPRESY